MVPLSATCDEREFAARVEALEASPAQLLDLLREDHEAYRERSSQAVVRMRGWVFVVLARGGLPREALPFVLEDLDSANEPGLVAAAAMALRATTAPQPEFVPFLRSALRNLRGHDARVDLTAYGIDDSAAATSGMRELLRTVAWMGSASSGLTTELAALRASGALSADLIPEFETAAKAAGRGQAAPATADCCRLPGLGWFSNRVPSSAAGLDQVTLEDQSGDCCSFPDLCVGQPTIVTFFYTRCDNPLKCSLTIWKLARAQRLLAEQGLDDKVRIAAVTYDPDFDTPPRLAAYARNRGFKPSAGHRLLRAVRGFEVLFDHFGRGAGFVGRLVNRHRIEIYVLDREGCIVASWLRQRWDEAQLVAKVAALVGDARSEPAPGPPSHPGAAAGTAAGPVAAGLVALLPKCPACWAAYMSACGLGAVADPSVARGVWLLVALLLAVNLASVFWRARSTQRWSGFAACVAGTLIVVADFTGVCPGVALIGAALLAFGSLIGVRSQRRPSLLPQATSTG